MEAYFVAKWVHILSSTILFGTGIGTALHMWLTHLNGDVRSIAVVSRNVVRADWWFTAPSGILQPVSGAYLIYLVGYDWTEPWLHWSYALYCIALVCWLPVVWLQIRVRDLAADAVETGTALPPLYFRYMRLWFALGWPAFIGLVGIFYLMVAKPV